MFQYQCMITLLTSSLWQEDLCSSINNSATLLVYLLQQIRNKIMRIIPSSTPSTPHNTRYRWVMFTPSLQSNKFYHTSLLMRHSSNQKSLSPISPPFKDRNFENCHINNSLPAPLLFTCYIIFTFSDLANSASLFSLLYYYQRCLRND